MKLHLTKSLRAALLACVCGAVASTAWAETLNLTSGSTSVGTATNAYSEIVVNKDAYLDFNSSGSVPLTFTGDVSIAGSGGGGKSGALTVDSNGSADAKITGTLTSTADAVVQLWGSRELSVNALTLSSGTLTINENTSYAKGTMNVAGDVSGAGSLKLAAGSLEVSGSITVAQGSELTASSGSTIKLNNAISNSGKLSLNGGIEVSDTLASALTKTTGVVYSDGINGFAAEGDIYSGLISGSGTVSASGVTVKQGETVLGSLLNTGLITKATGEVDYSTYYVKESGDLTTASMNAVTDGGKILVEEGKTLTVKSGVCGDLNKNVTLSENSTLNLENRSAMNNVQITLAGDAAISMYGTSMRGDVSGTGNLTLKQNTGNVAYIKGDINNTGKVTIEGYVQFQKDGSDIGTIGSSVDAVVVGTGNTLVLENAQANSFDLELSGTGKVQVTNSSTLTLGADSVVTGGTMTVSGENSVLDLTNVTTLTFDSLNLAAGSTIKLGEGTRITFTESLTIGEGVIFDLSSWCSYDGFTPYELFTYAGSAEGYSPTLPTNVTILTSDGLTNELAWLDYDADTQKVKLIPEPTTAPLSLLALAGLADRRRRK